MTIFLETSALLRMLFGQDGADQVESRLRGAERIVASRLLQVETERALLRLALDHPEAESWIPDLRREARDLWARSNFLEMTRAICAKAGVIAPGAHLRTLDAIHLASYYRVREISSDVEMLTFDQRILAQLAQAGPGRSTF